MKRFTTIIITTFAATLLFALTLTAHITLAGDDKPCCPNHSDQDQPLFPVSQLAQADDEDTPTTTPAELLDFVQNPEKNKDADDSDADTATEVLPNTNVPPGHPPLPQGHPPLPGGHPPLPGGSSGLPQGHPTVNEDELKPLVATLIIKTAQATANAPALNGNDVTIQFVHRGQPIDEQKTKLDKHGIVMLEALEFPRAVQPVVTIEHQGVEYKAVGYPMTASQPDQIVRVEVYDSTTTPPPWEIAMRHVMLKRADGLHIEEVMTVTNPTDKTWRAKAEGDDPGATVVFPLPQGADQLQLGPGFDRTKTRLVDADVMTHAAIIPGTTKFRYRYRLPQTSAGVTLAIEAPAPIKHMMVFVPDDGQVVRSENLDEGQPMKTGQSQVRVYSAQDVQAGTIAKLVFPGPSAANTPQTNSNTNAAAYPPTESHDNTGDNAAKPRTTRVVAGVGGAALILGAVLILFRKPTQTQTN